MTTAMETDRLTLVGPGTPMGRMMRAYWVPALLTREIDAVDGAPQRVRLLGEDLVAYRDLSGQLGLIGEHCPHRGVSLTLARNEDCGLRCIYHAWKIDETGRVLETPNEPDRSKLKDTFTHTAYPVREGGGIIWAYMGPGDPPPFPTFQWMSLPPAHVSLVLVRQRANWLQAIESVLDSAHTNALHSTFVRVDPATTAPDGASVRMDGAFSRPSDDTSPRLRALDTSYGFRYGAIRTTIEEPDKFKYVRTSSFIAPFHVMLSSSVDFGDIQAYVPIDDEHTALFYAHYNSTEPVDDDEWREWIGCRSGVDLDEQCWPIRTARNQWLQDRAAMRNGESFSGVSGVLNEDFAVIESMGPRYDRSREHLGTTDLAVLHLRTLLLKSLKAFEAGEPALGLGDVPIPYARIRPEDRVIPIDQPWETVGADREDVDAMIVDVHGHLSAPTELYAYKSILLAGRGYHGEDGPGLSDEKVHAAAAAHVAQLDGVGTDVQLLSPRPFHLMHGEKPEKIVRWWVRANNNVIARVCSMFPTRFLGVCGLPQPASGSLAPCIEELDRCVKELGFVGCLINPDPSEGTEITPPMGDEYWFPLYERMVQLDVPALMHPAGCRNPRLSYSLNFINEEAIAIMSLLDEAAHVFETFPSLKIIVPHGGGSVPYQLGRWQSAARIAGRSPFEERLRALWFDTTLYSKPALELLISTVGHDRVMFGTELPGSGGGIDPATGRPMDDLRPVIEDIAWLTAEQRALVFAGNAVAVHGEDFFVPLGWSKETHQ